MINIAENLQNAQTNIRQLAIQSQRDPQDIDLLAVSKTKPLEAILTAYQQGQRKFGENYASELHQKAMALATHQDIEWHFIGPIQSNKTALIANSCHWIHSISREKIAARLAAQRDPQLPPLNVLIQVNIDQEQQKSGVKPSEIWPLAAHIHQLPSLKLRGLMAIPKHTEQQQQQTQAFCQLNDCFQQLKTQYNQVDTLSMGMSSDLAAAIAQGTTMVRLGTAIFGAREPKT